MSSERNGQGNSGQTVDSAASREMWSDIDRRAHARFDTGLGGFAKSLHQTRPQPVEQGESFPVTVVDLSETGLKLHTPHELGLGDRLEIVVDDPAGGSTPLRRTVRVLWTGQTSQQQWSAGTEFVETPQVG